jgi:amidase
MMFNKVTTMASDIASGAITSVDYCNEYISRINTKNPLINAVVARRPDATILAEAAAADARAAAGTRLSQIDGVPFTLKAMWETEGLRTTDGYTLDFTPDAGRNSDVAAILKQAGAVLLGKTNAMGGAVYTEPTLTGRTKNPHNFARTTAGSSGGAAAAVAAGLTGFDIGTDAAGSVRMPASYCGVYGFKPTLGAISSFGDTVPTTRDRPPLMKELCSPGPITRSIDDAILLVKILNRQTLDDPFVRPLWPENPRPLQKVSVIDAYSIWHSKGGEVETAFEGLIDRLELAGVIVDRPPPFSLTPDQYDANYQAHWHRIVALIGRRFPTVNPHAATFGYGSMWLDNDTVTYHGELKTADARKVSFGRAYMNRMGDADVIITPTHAVTAPAFTSNGQPPAPNTGITYMCMSVLFNMIGAPSISIPLGIDANGVPFGVQVAGRPHDDLNVLDFAKQIDAHCLGFIPPAL